MSFMEGKGQWKSIDHGSKKTEGQVVGSKSINVLYEKNEMLLFLESFTRGKSSIHRSSNLRSTKEGLFIKSLAKVTRRSILV